MKQRLGIAAALLKRPRLLILDEPSNGLDPAGIRDVRELIRRLGQDGHTTVLLSSHLLAEVQQVCDSVTILARGRRVATGPVPMSSPAAPPATCGSAFPTPPPPRRCWRRGLRRLTTRGARRPDAAGARCRRRRRGHPDPRAARCVPRGAHADDRGPGERLPGDHRRPRGHRPSRRRRLRDPDRRSGDEHRHRAPGGRARGPDGPGGALAACSAPRSTGSAPAGSSTCCWASPW